jgi:hypothetical protein
MDGEEQEHIMYAIKIDPTRLENSDLDIRYRLFDYLNELYPDVLQDGGYDYEGDQPLLVVCVKVLKDLAGLQHEAILESIVAFGEFGGDFKDAIEIFYDGQLLYPLTGQQDDPADAADL